MSPLQSQLIQPAMSHKYWQINCVKNTQIKALTCYVKMFPPIDLTQDFLNSMHKGFRQNNFFEYITLGWDNQTY